MGLAERREREKRHLRELILETAMDLFISDGYENVSIRRIADQIEYSPGTIYLYFKDKDDIFYQLHEQAFARYARFQQSAEQIADPLQRLIKLGENYLQFAMENPEQYELMFILKAPMRKIKKDMEWSCGLNAYGQLRRTVGQAIEQGKMKGDDVELVTMTMWAHVHGMASLIVRNRLAMIPEEMLPHMARGMLAYLNTLIKK